MTPDEKPHAFAASHAAGDEERIRDLLDRLPLTVFEFDREGRFVYVNRSGLEAFGYTEEELRQGVSVLQVIAPEDRDRLRANIARRLAGEPASRSDYTGLRKDGSTFPALVRATVINKNGHPAGMEGYLIDISERACAEAALRYRIELEQLIMGVSTELMAVLAPAELDARIESALGAIGRFMAVDRSYVFLVTPDGRLVDKTHEWVAEGIPSGRDRLQRIPLDTTFPWLARELRQRHVVAVASVADLPPAASAERAELQRQGIQSLVNVALIHAGTVVGFIGLDALRVPRSWSDDEIALLRILGEILMGAIARRRAEQALQESERKYKALVETTATGYVILDVQGRVLDANAEYVRLTGHHSLDEIRGRPVTDWIAPHDRERNLGTVDACLRKGGLRDLQVDYAHRDGTAVPVLINATVTQAEGARQIIAVVRDMSDRKRLESEMLRTEKLRSVGVLAGGIAHDFNNILTAILGNISLVRSTLTLEGPSDELLLDAEKATRAAGDLTRQLLTFSRGGGPVRRLFAPGAVVRDSAALALHGRATACELRLADDLWSLEADEGQIAQVLSNLVINASQAMAGGGTVTVAAENRHLRDDEIATLPEGDYLVLSVGDQGAGIAEEDRARIFDPYFTTKGEGRGLGLAVCYSIVANHGGVIVVDSELGRGSTFTVYLPAINAVSGEVQIPDPSLLSGEGRVLVMDDEAAVREVAGNIIRALGYQVDFARDGREAIEAWRVAREQGRPFDVVIMDLTVPGGMGGREAVRELLAIDPSAKAVVSSGYSQDPIMASYREHGFRDVIAKPYSAADMSRALATVLRQP